MEGQRINVEEIMRELRAEADSLDMPEIVEFDEMTPDLIYAKQGEEFEPGILFDEMELANHSVVIDSKIAIIGRGKFIKRVVRKLSTFIIGQLAEAITEHNIHVLRAMNQVRNYIISRDATDKDIVSIKNSIEEDSAWKETYSNRMRELSKENMELKKQVKQSLMENEESHLALEKTKTELELLKMKIQLLEDKYKVLPDSVD